MDSLDVNKAVAAILVAGIAFFITGLLGDNLVQEETPAKSAIAIQVAPPTGGAPPAPVGPAPIAPLLASANVQKGDTFVHQVCTACHTVDQGGKAIIGPNLYNIVDAPHDHMAGFDYSAALEKFKGKPWTYDQLNEWLFDPQTYAPGTHMTFTGIKNTQQRADVIAYLRTLSPHPEPLPAPTPAAKAAPPAPAAPGKVAPGKAAPAAGAPAAAPAAPAPAAPAAPPATAGAPGNAHAQTPSAGTQAGGPAAAPPTAGTAKP